MPLLFASGHRVFFLSMSLFGAVAIMAWLAAYKGELSLSPFWHGHEMIFGFAVAAIAGFLSAAVANWTGRPRLSGWPLVGLFLLWGAGRIALALDVAPVIDLLFLPVFAVRMGWDVVAAGNRRNFIVPVMLLVLAGLNGLYHYGDPSLALRAAIYTIAGLIALIGGRIVPAFTRNALKLPTARFATAPWYIALDRAAVPLVLALVLTELVWPQSVYSGIAAFLTGFVLAVRMVGWGITKVWQTPLLWVLHLGYMWLPLGFFMKGASDLFLIGDPSAALHALTAGAVGTMILAVASRAALGHSGRPLHAAPITVLAYGLVTIGAVLRVVLPLFWFSPAAIDLSGILWALAFLLFFWSYWPILTKPRIDGKPG